MFRACRECFRGDGSVESESVIASQTGGTFPTRCVSDTLCFRESSLPEEGARSSGPHERVDSSERVLYLWTGDGNGVERLGPNITLSNEF